MALVAKNPPANARIQEMQVSSLVHEDPLEESTAAPSSILVWKFPWTVEPGWL